MSVEAELECYRQLLDRVLQAKATRGPNPPPKPTPAPQNMVSMGSLLGQERAPQSAPAPLAASHDDDDPFLPS